MEIAAATAADRTLHGATVAAEHAPHPRPKRGGMLRHRRAAGDDFNERRALDGSDERDAAPRERPLLIRHARIAIHGRLAQGRGHADGAPGPPLRHQRRREISGHRQPDAATRRAASTLAARAHDTGLDASARR